MTQTHVPRTDPVERFWSYVDKSGDCWNWTGKVTPKGYARFWHQGGPVFAHRFAYELLVGPIAPRLTIDHLCVNPSCVNPAHMETVTNGENTMRQWARKWGAEI